MSTSHNLGGALIPLVVAFAVSQWGWRGSMFLPGAICVLASFWLFNRLRDVPQSLGLPAVEKFKGDSDGFSQQSPVSSTSLSMKNLIIQNILTSKAIWILALSYFFVYVVRTAVSDWGMLYLIQVKNLSNLEAASSITWFEVGGFMGSLAGGLASDKFFRGQRVPYMILCAVGLLLVTIGIWYLPTNSLLLANLVFGAHGFLIFGPQLLVGLAAAEFVQKEVACTANGFAGCFAYVGAAFTGYPLGKIIDLWQWQGFFIVLGFSSIAILVILSPLWLYNRSKQVADVLKAAPSGS